MKTANLSRKVAENFPFPRTPQDWMISISCHDHDAPNLPEFDKLLSCVFDDVDDDEPHTITVEQAQQIAEFINEAKKLEKNVWVHCHAGICRSGAVVEVLLLLGWHFVDNDFSESRIPNKTVFNRIRQQFPELRYSWEI